MDAAIREEIEKVAGRSRSIGSLYTTIERLKKKGMLKTWMGAATAQRGDTGGAAAGGASANWWPWVASSVSFAGSLLSLGVSFGLSVELRHLLRLAMPTLPVGYYY